MRTLFQDVRFGWRLLGANPTFTIVAVITLALGIASTATVFAWIDGLLMHPYHGAAGSGELAVLETVAANAPNGGNFMSWVDYRDYRDNLKMLSGIAVRRECALTTGDGPGAKLAWGELVSGNYFDVLGVRAVLGRTFTAEETDESPGAHPVVVISHSLWRNRFHSDPGIAGKILRVNRHDLTVVGVAPAEFHGTNPVMLHEVWLPATMGAELGVLGRAAYTRREYRDFNAVARLKPGATVEQARAEAEIVGAGLASTYPKSNRGITARVVRPWEEGNGVNEYLMKPLRILAVVSLVVLLIVCANVANLLLARSVTRQREFGIRLALGAGRVRIARQMFVETLLLAGGGAIASYPLMLWMTGLIPSLVPDVGLPIAATGQPGLRTFLFTALVCVTATLISGAAPALFSFRPDLNSTLKEGGRTGTPSSAARRTRGLLVIVEVALAVVALIGAGLFVRSFQNARAMHTGFDATRVLFARFYIESAAYSKDQILQFSERLKQRLESTTGIEAVSYSDFTPLSTTAGPYDDVHPAGYLPATGESMNVNRSLVSPGYFDLMRIPLVAGRDFTPRDDEGAAPVMIVTEAFSQRYFGGENPVGRRLQSFGKDFTIIGLVKDSKYFSPTEAPRPFFYIALKQFYRGSPQVYCFIKTRGEPEQQIATLRRAVAEVDPNALGYHAVPLAEYTQVALLGQKVAAYLTAGLGLMCLVLAAIGLYSVMSYAVSQRTQEFGIRMAMGARPAAVVGMVLREGMTLTAGGLLAGSLIGLLVTRLVASMLFEVSAMDPLTFIGAGVFLALVSVAALWIPAMRATRVDPIQALRN